MPSLVFVGDSSSNSNASSKADVTRLKHDLEHGNDIQRIAAIKSALSLLSTLNSGADVLLMPIIRFVLPNQRNKLLKKLVLLYFELVPKRDANGQALPELILLCNALRADLEHANEYVTGSTLRFLTRITEVDVLEPLVPSIISCLQHRHAYVRRNAVAAVHALAMRPELQALVPDASEVLSNLLLLETDLCTQTAAFRALIDTDLAVAVQFISNANSSNLPSSHFQLALVDCLKASQAHPHQMLAIVLDSSLDSIVRFGAADALIASGAVQTPTICSAVCQCYVQLVTNTHCQDEETLIILQRLAHLQSVTAQGSASACRSEDIRLILTEVLVNRKGSLSLAARKEALGVVIRGLHPSQVQDAVAFAVHELQAASAVANEEYKHALLDAIDTLALKHPSIVAPTAATSFLSILAAHHSTSNAESKTSNLSHVPIDALHCLKRMMTRSTEMQPIVIRGLLDTVIGSGTSSNQPAPLLISHALWIIGEYGGLNDQGPFSADIVSKLHQLYFTIGDSSENPSKRGTSNLLNVDGTYAMQVSDNLGDSDHRQSDASCLSLLQSLVMQGHYHVAVQLAHALCKLCSRCKDQMKIRTIAMSIIVHMIRLGLRPISPSANIIDKDSYDRLILALQIVSQSSDLSADCRQAIEQALLKDTHEALNRISIQNSLSQKDLGKDPSSCAIDEFIRPRLLASSRAEASSSLKDTRRIDLQRAISTKPIAIFDGGSSRQSCLQTHDDTLARVVQLTGFSDEIYAECYVIVSGTEILLDVLIVNQIDDTLQSLTMEMAANGPIRQLERPRSITMAPGSFAMLKLAFKVNATANGAIHGCISYAHGVSSSASGHLESTCVILQSISIDITEFIQPVVINEDQFRRTWVLLEWENKATVPTLDLSFLGSNSQLISESNHLKYVLESLLKQTHLECLTPRWGISDSGEFLAANLHATSIFGEEILANLCLERSISTDDRVTVSGHLRLRSRTQGVAVAVGDRISEVIASIERSH